MKSNIRLITAALLLLISANLSSQGIYPSATDIYGLDPLLYNGRKYTYFLPPAASGHQFLSTTEFHNGNVTIKGKTFYDLSLNYDVYNQQLLLRYEDDAGSGRIIELSTAWLEDFTLEGMKFTCLDSKNGARFYQVIGHGNVRFLYYWKKEFRIEPGTVPANYIFTQPKKSSFIEIKDDIVPFRGKRSFLKVFDQDDKSAVRSYLRQHRLSLKSASDEEMAALADFISRIVK